MRIEVSNDGHRIEGFCNHSSWSTEDCVIVFNKCPSTGEWSVGSSRCLPSNLDDADIIQKCVSAAFEELKKHRI